MKKGDIVSVVAMSGEYVGEFVSDDNGLTIANPKMIVNSPQGGMGFSKGVAVTGEENPPSMTFSTYVFVVPSSEKIAEAHTSAVKGEPLIQAPAEKKIIT
jgi:hypothetical protein